LFERQQEKRARNFGRLRELMSDVGCLQPLDVHQGVRRHGMYMFVMRYRPGHCGGLALDEFLSATGAEGAPLHRCYSSTISAQPAMQKIRVCRPEYMRILPTPVADRAVNEIVYIAASVFLGSEADMEDVAAAVQKVERHYSARGSEMRELQEA
jgi:hypothetical protein